MTRLHEGLDYLLYRIYVWGGLAALVIHILVSTLVLDLLSQPRLALWIIVGPLTLWILGILAYWWWVFLFKGRRDLPASASGGSERVPPIAALRSWGTLQAAMALYGGDVEAMIKAEKAGRRPVIIFFGMQNLMVLWVLGGFWAGNLLLDDTGLDLAAVWVFGVPVLAVLTLAVPFLLAGRAGRAGEAAYLAPLGLSVIESPSPRPDMPGLPGQGQWPVPKGATVLEGTRRGHRVRIETLGRHSLTWLHAPTPPFHIRSQEGKLRPDKGAPEAVIAALRSLRKAKRWRGVEAAAGPEGMAIQRESSGLNMWLYDLWLAEYLFEHLFDAHPSDEAGRAKT